jgi:hypothetical protein
MLIQDCQPDPKRLGVLAECLNGDPSEGEWPMQYLSTKTVAYSCGILARQQDKVVHAHDSEELQRCQRLAGEAAQIMQGIWIGLSDEGDHTLDPFYIPANSGDPVRADLTDQVFRTAMRGTIYPKAVLTVEPLARSSPWFQRVSKISPDSINDPTEQKRVAQWGRLLDWFQAQQELHSLAYIGFEESGNDGYAAVFPRFFIGLTAAGSLVGLATCVVWT